MKDCEIWNLDKVKKEFSVFEKKHKLPKFDKLNEDFDIERIAEKETDFLLREIRKTIADKILAYLRFLEILINPANGGPMFFFMIVKGLNVNDKTLVEETYKKIAKYELDAIALDNRYDEKAEAVFINKVCGEWKDVKDDIDKLVSIMKESWEKETEKNDKGYFG